MDFDFKTKIIFNENKNKLNKFNFILIFKKEINFYEKPIFMKKLNKMIIFQLFAICLCIPCKTQK